MQIRLAVFQLAHQIFKDAQFSVQSQQQRQQQQQQQLPQPQIHNTTNINNKSILTTTPAIHWTS